MEECVLDRALLVHTDVRLAELHGQRHCLNGV